MLASRREACVRRNDGDSSLPIHKRSSCVSVAFVMTCAFRHRLFYAFLCRNSNVWCLWCWIFLGFVVSVCFGKRCYFWVNLAFLVIWPFAIGLFGLLQVGFLCLPTFGFFSCRTSVYMGERTKICFKRLIESVVFFRLSGFLKVGGQKEHRSCRFLEPGTHTWLCDLGHMVMGDRQK